MITKDQLDKIAYDYAGDTISNSLDGEFNRIKNAILYGYNLALKLDGKDPLHKMNIDTEKVLEPNKWSSIELDKLESIDALKLSGQEKEFYKTMIKFASTGIIPSTRQLAYIHVLSVKYKKQE